MKGLLDLGSPVMLLLGVALVISAVVVFVKGEGAAPALAVVLVFGTLLSGTGT